VSRIPRPQPVSVTATMFSNLYDLTRDLPALASDTHRIPEPKPVSDKMTVFGSKEAFLELGLQQVKPSGEHTLMDCSICTKPLDLLTDHGSLQYPDSGYHTAGRIVACGHMHGEECLAAWLDMGHTCPTCNRILFEPKSDCITQEDVNNVANLLGPVYGERRVWISIDRVVSKEEYHDKLHHYLLQEIAKQRTEDVNMRDEFNLTEEDFLDSDGGFMDSDEEPDSDKDIEDGEEVRDDE
jgi:hypothetical protein